MAQSILIIGAGIFGTSTAYHLSRSPPHPDTTVTVIDRTPYPPKHAASTDINKIVRTDYTSRFYMELAESAMQAWSTWPELRPFFHRTGWINIEKEGSNIGERIRRNFIERGCDPTSDVVLDDGLRERWGGLLKETSFEGLGGAYWNPEVGWVDAGAAVEKMMEMAMSRGVRYVCGDVERLVLGEKGVKGVRLREGATFEAEKVLLCTGAWTSALMSGTEDELGIEEKDRVERQASAAGVCCAHFRLTDEEMKEMEKMPIVIYADQGDVQPPPKRNGPEGNLLKCTNARSFSHYVTTRSGHRISVPPDRDQRVVPKWLQQETLDEMALKAVPQYASRGVEYFRLCWDSITPQQEQLLTKHPHPQLSNLYLAIGGSFHSWKFLPIIGEFVANVLCAKSNGEDKDATWAWKLDTTLRNGAHEKVIPERDLKDLEDNASPM